MINFIHTGDFHLDAPYVGFRDEKKSKAMRLGLLKAFDEIIDFALKNPVDFMFIPGDIFDGNSVLDNTADHVLNGFSKIPSVKIMITLGNHDFSCTHIAKKLQELDNVYVFGNDKIEKFDFPELGAAVYGKSFKQKYEEETPLSGFLADDGRINFMVIHGDVKPSGESLYLPLYESDMEKSGILYYALGHRHNFEGLKKGSGYYYAYCGTPAGHGFDETGQKGFLYGKADENTVSVDFIALNARRYYEKEVLIDGSLTLSEIAEAADVSDGNGLYKIILKGEINENCEIDMESLLQLLEDKCFFAKIYDNTQIKLNLSEAANEYSLKGIFIKKMQALMENAEEGEKEKYMLALKLALSAFSK